MTTSGTALDHPSTQDGGHRRWTGCPTRRIEPYKSSGLLLSWSRSKAQIRSDQQLQTQSGKLTDVLSYGDSYRKSTSPRAQAQSLQEEPSPMPPIWAGSLSFQAESGREGELSMTRLARRGFVLYVFVPPYYATDFPSPPAGATATTTSFPV